MLEQLDGAADSRGVAAQERAARAVAAAVRTSMPSMAACVYGTIRSKYQSLGDFSKAIKHHGQFPAIAKEVGDRAGERLPRHRVRRTGTSGVRMSRRRVTSARPSSTTRRKWRLQRRWAPGRGRARRKGTSGVRMIRRGTLARPSSTTRSTWRVQRRWATGRGRAPRTETSALATST
jgi:hypothetical protein